MTRNEMQELNKLEIVYADSDIANGCYYFIILRKCKFIPIKISSQGIFEYESTDNYDAAVNQVFRGEHIQQDYMTIMELCECLQ